MRRAELLRLSLFLALAAGIAWALMHRAGLEAADLEHWVEGAGLWAPGAFIAVYAIAAVLFLPGSVLTLAGGALFGPLWGTLYSLTGAALGATLAFLVARHLASDWVATKSGGRLRKLMDGVEAEGWRFVAFVRLVPLFPFNLSNYALGLTRIRLAHYVAATYAFMLPGGFAYTYLGYAGREAVAGGEGMIRKALLALGSLVVVAFIPRLVKRLRAAPMMTTSQLKGRLDGSEDLLMLDVRGPDEYAGELGHIRGARNIPLDELPHRLSEIAHRRERSIAILCRTDKRSAKAATILARAEFPNVWVVRGGMEQWNQEGREVARATLSTEPDTANRRDHEIPVHPQRPALRHRALLQRPAPCAGTAQEGARRPGP
jgi:uncharacterized membrane protein YdjX (TVP38/TMEM64 family)/rhodanese-related sulfurtransferase